MLRKILLGVAVVILGFVILVASRPADFRVTRTTLVSAPTPVVFDQVNDFHRWDAWSPWAKIDPAMKTTFAGSPSGTGAIYSWSGNREVGDGRMTITDSRPHDHLGFKIEFLKPFAATNAAEFTFTPEAGQTRVTWSMFGKCNFMLKGMSLFASMDKMVGGDFEKGLAQLKAVAEHAPAP